MQTGMFSCVMIEPNVVNTHFFFFIFLNFTIDIFFQGGDSQHFHYFHGKGMEITLGTMQALLYFKIV